MTQMKYTKDHEYVRYDASGIGTVGNHRVEQRR